MASSQHACFIVLVMCASRMRLVQFGESESSRSESSNRNNEQPQAEVQRRREVAMWGCCCCSTLPWHELLS
eukprot:880486-Pelagomonas_calceolata.AAC.1